MANQETTEQTIPKEVEKVTISAYVEDKYLGAISNISWTESARPTIRDLSGRIAAFSKTEVNGQLLFDYIEDLGFKEDDLVPLLDLVVSFENHHTGYTIKNVQLMYYDDNYIPATIKDLQCRHVIKFTATGISPND